MPRPWVYTEDRVRSSVCRLMYDRSLDGLSISMVMTPNIDNALHANEIISIFGPLISNFCLSIPASGISILVSGPLISASGPLISVSGPLTFVSGPFISESGPSILLFLLLALLFPIDC